MSQKRLAVPIDDSWYRRPARIRQQTLAGGVVLRRRGRRWYVALIQEGASPGYSLPKGHRRSGETLVQAARREIREEAGIKGLRLAGDLGVRERLNFARTAWNVTRYFVFVAGPGSGPAASTRSGARWFPLNELPPMFWREQRELLRRKRRHLTAVAGPADG